MDRIIQNNIDIIESTRLKVVRLSNQLLVGNFSSPHPFTFDDIKQLRKFFNKVKIQYYGFFTLLFLPFYKSPKESKIFLILSRLDKILFTIPFLKFLAWSVLIEARKS